MVRLYGGDHAQRFVLLKIFRRYDLVMLNAEAEVLLIALLDCVGKCVQRHARASVANGVKANLEIVIRAFGRHRVQLVLFVALYTGIFWIVSIWREHGGGA